ncbi:LPS-assembly protein LptD [Aquamicrobium sp. LC103]|nr:LPS-assembly protein LptD [Aquamicrobium sp. LC103]
MCALNSRSARHAWLAGATALACVFAYTLAPDQAWAQDVDFEGAQVSEDAEMLLEADTLVYDNDRNTVTAVGGVQIDYDGNRLVAQRVAYDRNTRKLIATGAVEIVDRDGTKIYSDEIDVTDDFRDGFVNALRVETTDKTYFAAESAERRSGTVTTFNRGIYTACEPCEEKPDKPPIWRIKAQKIIWNGEAKTVRFERARFEMFGFPLAFLPAFEVADPTVKRKSGFLIPSYQGSSKLGYGVQVPYYLALSPTFDATFYPTYYSKQGFLGMAEWRQRFNNGAYDIRIAGIRQQSPEEFDPGTVDSREKFRGMIGTKGEFQINPRWSFGWDVLAQTDKNFSRTYSIDGFNQSVHRSQVYLTGLNDRNYFDLRAYRFEVQERLLDADPRSRSEKQPWVLPSFDYSYTPDEAIAGGELNIDVNAQSLYRRELDRSGWQGSGDSDALVRGTEGWNGRVTAEAEWKRSFIAPGGLMLTPLLAARGDAIGTSYSGLSEAAIADLAGTLGVEDDIRSAYFRSMATAGLEARWPILFSTTSSTHVLEPMGQIFARPDAAYQNRLGIPNEDAQSLVFDATSLFERDKFSGFDRIEGGTRANLGVRYSGAFQNGWGLHGLAGQSYHLAGDNPFASPDLVSAGAYSGLESDRSDYVAMVGLTTPVGLSFSAGGRFDEDSFEMRRTDLTAGYTTRPFSIVGRYSFIEAQAPEEAGDPPAYGFDSDRQEVQLSASARFFENWRVFGSGTYDLEKDVLVARSIGFAYDDECFAYSFTVSETENRDTNEVDRSFGFSISLRTIGDFGTASNSPFASSRL